MIDLAAERAVIGALLTGALSPRDVEPDAFGHPHHRRLVVALVSWREMSRRVRGLDTIPLFAPFQGMPATAPPLPLAFAFGITDGEPASLLSMARSAPRKWPALEALRTLRDLATLRDDAVRDREALVSAAASMVDGLLSGYTRQVRADAGIVCRGGEDRAYVRPIDDAAIPTPRSLRRDVFAKLSEERAERRTVPEWLEAQWDRKFNDAAGGRGDDAIAWED